ncbi:unnamed protein product [Rotaria magnacalcarata]|uniref:Uncharacterized protein n=1 Tax=Rotaria magnacalcarata TaxID=392030 RepID=A0A819ITD4_9BILA|nr:unnamed protein product [Rotaria magnacalcarata]CAF4018712.1 unnamed protein product [Rotaria magnacalcarata]
MNRGGRGGALSYLDPENQGRTSNSTESDVESVKKNLNFLYDSNASTNQRKLLTKKQEIDQLTTENQKLRTKCKNIRDQFKELQKETNELIPGGSSCRLKGHRKRPETTIKRHKTALIFTLFRRNPSARFTGRFFC